MVSFPRTNPPRRRAPSHPLILSVLALLAVALVSCSRKAPDSQTTRSGATQARTVQVSRIDLGRAMTADRRVITTGETSFTPHDTVFAAVSLAPPVPAAQITARWTSADGQVVSESTQMVAPSETEEVAQFHVVKPGGLEQGTYKLEILVDGQVVSSKEFTITAT